MTSRPMRIAMLGCGWAARLHSKTLRGLGPDFVLYYASRDEGRAREANVRYAGAGAFGSYEAALQSPDVDVALILTPPESHLAWTLRALDAGKDVVVEKPPFLRSGDFDTVQRACRETGKRVFVAENYFYKPLAVRLRQILGDVLFLHINAVKKQESSGWREEAAVAGGGALFEGGIHWIDFAAHLGLTVQRVRAARPGAGEGLDRSMLVLFEYEEGPVGTLAYSWEVPSPLKGVRLSRIYGREGSVLFETNGLFLAVLGRKKRLYFPGVRDLAGYRGMFLDFLRAWRTGGEPELSLARARRDLELVEEAYRTAGRNHHQKGQNQP
jgi:UDP-N-acetylglucosamine 3-dehydrogenase